MWRGAVLGAAILLASAGAQEAADEWPGWRGPGGDGVSTAEGLVSGWSAGGENLCWKADFVGRSTPVVLDGRVYVIGRVGEGVARQEIVAAFDAGDGRRLWEHRFNVYHTTVPFNRVGWASLVADPETGNVHAHGVAGQLQAYDRDGKLLWSSFLAETFGHLSGYGGRTQTPTIEGDQLVLSFVNAGWGDQAAPRHRYFSFDKRTGDLLWVSTPGKFPYDMNTQAGTVPATVGGRRVLVSGNADGHVYALDANTGDKIWGFQLSKGGLNVTPVVHGDRVYASHSEENVDAATMGRVVAIDAAGNGDVTKTHEVWRIDELEAGFSSPAYHDGWLYVVDNAAKLHGIDAKTGAVRWTHPLGTVGKGSPVWADGKLYVTEVNGRFHILKPGADGATSLDTDELEVADGRYAEIYGSPAIAYGRVYFATEGGVYCLGDPSKKIEVPERAPRAGDASSGENAARLLVVPGESILAPGETLRLSVRAFDAVGRRTETPAELAWTLDGLAGEMSGSTYRAPSNGPSDAGRIVVRAGDVEGAARVRVIPPLPWSEGFDAREPGSVPESWVGAPGKFQVGEKDGARVLVKPSRDKGLLRNELYMGPSGLANYTIEADVMAGARGRRRSDVGLIAAGYTLDLLGNHQRLQVRSWTSEDRMMRQIDFAWEPDRWYRMEMRVENGKDKAVIRGKVWPRGGDEPAAWTITVDDPVPVAGGSPGLIGYSPADVYYDNIVVKVND